MNRCLYFLLFFLCLPRLLQGDDPRAANAVSEVDQSKKEDVKVGKNGEEGDHQSYLKVLDMVKVSGDGELVKLLEEWGKEILEQNYLDNETVYSSSREIKKHIRSLFKKVEEVEAGNEGGVSVDKKDLVLLLEYIDSITDDLIEESYFDEQRKNTNLSLQIEGRFPRLVQDIKAIAEGGDSPDEHALEDFKKEYTVLSNRYLHSKKFRMGIGFSYTYTPDIEYSGFSFIDLSSFDPDLAGGSGRLAYDLNFSNRSYAGLQVAARVPYVDVEAVFPVYEEKVSLLTPVARHTDSNILYQSSVESRITMEYEASLGLSVRDFLRKRSGFRWLSSQVDFGVGAGVSGFRIEDDISTDIRFQIDESMPFRDLEVAGTAVQTRHTSVSNLTYIVYCDVEINDEIEVGLNLKFHEGESKGGVGVDVDGASIAMVVSWYPTGLPKFFKRNRGED